MDLGHRIIAMVGGQPKRVICQTCNSQHNYRAPKSVTGVTKRASGASSSRSSAARPSGPRLTKAESERRMDWEGRIAGQPVQAFTRYAMDQAFREGQLVTHKKFGEGFVVELLEDNKVSIMFRDGVRTLARKQGD
ncbi:MAG TPA: hypothetical protein VKZ49_18100 [Polyangiaceae bacterium]|nr:hypothetical protein [Polyangiaceae bacterium]